MLTDIPRPCLTLRLNQIIENEESKKRVAEEQIEKSLSANWGQYQIKDLFCPSMQQLKSICTERQIELLSYHFMKPLILAIHKRIFKPISIQYSGTEKIVTFMNVMRFHIDIQTGKVRVECLKMIRPELWIEIKGDVAVDLPLRVNGLWLRAIVENHEQLFRIRHDTQQIIPRKIWSLLFNSIAKMLLQAISWRLLRHDLQKAINLNPELLNWMRIGRQSALRFVVTDKQYNRALEHLNQYKQIAKENPNLMWIFNLAIDMDISLKDGDVILLLKQHFILEQGISQAGWRYLQLCNSKHFWHIIELHNGRASARARWKLICEWLKLMTVIGKREPLNAEIAKLFFQDNVEVSVEMDMVRFRLAWFPKECLKAMLVEAEFHYK